MIRDKPIRVLIADDHPVVREGLSAIINRQRDMEVVAEASSGLEAVEQFVRYLPDITLVDLRMPSLDGAATVSNIRSRFPTAKIVIMSAYEGEDEICNAILAGAEGFLSKASPRAQLLGCIREVHEGKKRIPPEIAPKLAQRAVSSNLSDRELEVLNLLAVGKTNKEAGAAMKVTEETIKVCLNGIFAKLGVTGRVQAIAKAIKSGLIHLR